MIGLLSVLIVLGTVLGIMLGGGGRGFRPRLAKTYVGTGSGLNAASILAVVAIASLILEAGTIPVVSGIPSVAPLLTALAVVLIIGVVVGPGLTELIVGLFAVGVLAISVGVTGTITLVILIVLMFWLMLAARRWMG